MWGKIKTPIMRTKRQTRIIILIAVAFMFCGCSLQITIGKPVYQKIEAPNSKTKESKEDSKEENHLPKYSYDWTRGYKMRNNNL